MKKRILALTLSLCLACSGSVVVQASDDNLAVDSISPESDVSWYFPKVGEVAVSLKEVHIRVGPGLDQQILDTIKPDESVTVLGYEGEWMKIDRGYCYAGYFTSDWFGNTAITGDNLESAKYIGMVYSKFSDLPREYRELIRGYSVLICQNMPFTNDNGKPVQGRTEITTGEKKMWLSMDANALLTSVYHEAAHIIDSKDYFNDKGIATHNFISDEDDFQRAWKAENEAFKTYYFCDEDNTNTPQEYFAEAYAQLMVDADKVKKNFPKTYQAMSNLVEF